VTSFFCPFLVLLDKISRFSAMKYKILAIASLLAFFTNVNCQNISDINKTDQKGLKQGPWVKKDSSGIVLYEGTFKDGHPVGEFRRYYSDKTLLSLLIYSSDGKTADATMYYPNSFIASKGKYINQKKEGVWKFFSSSVNGYLINDESYKNDKKNGLSVKYFPDSTVAEKINYLNGRKDGEWLQYYPGGKLFLKSFYTGDLLNGKFEVWYENGKLQFSGSYKNNLREGKWDIYNKDGSLKYELNYVNGMTNDKQMDIDASDYFENLEKNRGKIADPEKTGVIR
jgi:antitoxin component YwqK of YwqJK toxin-antitoxin module